MTPLRLAAIAVIYLMSTIAWFTLGTSVSARSGEFDERLSQEVALLWGGPHVQAAPAIWFERQKTITENVQRTDANGVTVTEAVTRVVTERVPIALEASDIAVGLTLEHRQKGLLWFDTYGVGLSATYRARNSTPEAHRITSHLRYPAEHVQLDNFVFRVNGRDAEPTDDLSKGATTNVEVAAGGDIVIEVAYASRGLDTWSYAPAADGMAEVRDFSLVMETDFDQIDFLPGSMSPSTNEAAEGGWRLGWSFDDLLTDRQIGMDLPNRTNPGPLAARITYFAPVSLLFFVTVMVILGVLQGRNLHPMNYAFLSAAFFAFHLLLAYLVDHVSIHWSFVTASLVSILLVTSYLRVVAGPRFAILTAGLAQLVFLVLFSYAFFFEGFTGLTVTFGAVVTLFVLMQATARVDWNQIFAGARPREAGRS
jgi:hypothetical protein